MLHLLFILYYIFYAIYTSYLHLNILYFSSKYKDIMQSKVDSQSYILPPQMSTIISATIAQTSHGEVILCHDSNFLYAARVVRGGGNVTFQKFALASVVGVTPVIKNYFMAVMESKRLTVFEVGFNEENKIMLKFIYNRQRPIASTFLREVADNMAELQICFPDNEIVIHQFTVNGKVGVMNYMINEQKKLSKCERAQLYGSKSMFCANRRTIYYFTSFSNKNVSNYSLAKLETDLATQYGAFPLTYLSKNEEFYVLLSNFTVVNVMNPSLHHRVYCEEKQVELVQKLADPKEADRYRAKDGNGLKVSTYLDMILIEDGDRGVSYVFQVKPKGSNLIAVEHGKINWFWTGSRKLVGISHDRSSFKIIDELRINEKIGDNPFLSALRRDYRAKEQKSVEEQVPFKLIKDDTPSPNKKIHHSVPAKEAQFPQIAQPPQKSEHLLQEQRFKPTKIIQKNKVSVSKTIHKSKQIEPISQEQQKNGNREEQIEKQKQPPQQQIEQIVEKQKQPQEKKEKNGVLDEQQIEQECQKMANAILDQKNPSSQSKQSKQEEKVSQQASCQQKQPRKQGDVFPKEESSLSESLIVPDKKEEQEKSLSIPQQQPKSEQIKQNESSLPKSLAVLIGKSTLGGDYSHPLNLFSTSINRNNIFGPIISKHERAAADPSLLRRHHSEQQYYNPFTTSSPCPSGLKPKKQEQSSQQKVEGLPQIRQLLEQTTVRLMKAVDQLANLKSAEPYLKDKTVEQLRKSVRDVMERMMVGEFTSRIQRYFFEVFKQTDQVQQQSIKFYKQANNHRANNIETHLKNQEKVLKEIRDIESNMRFCISHIKDSNRATFESLMRDWQQQASQTKKIMETVSAARAKIQAQDQVRAKRYEQTKQNLQAIKMLLAERINLEAEKKQKKLQREKQKEIDRDQKTKKDKTRKMDKKVSTKK